MHFFSPEVTKFFRVQVRIIARAGASARAPSCLWDWALLSCFKTRATETRFYTMEFFFSFTRIILYTFRKIHYNFFFMLCSYFQYNECKKNLEIREGRKEQWKPTSTPWNFFFLSREFSYIHSDTFLTIFFYAVFVFPV